MKPNAMLVVSIIALLFMFFFGLNLFLQGKGILFLLLPIGMAAFILYGYYNSAKK